MTLQRNIEKFKPKNNSKKTKNIDTTKNILEAEREKTRNKCLANQRINPYDWILYDYEDKIAKRNQLQKEISASLSGNTSENRTNCLKQIDKPNQKKKKKKKKRNKSISNSLIKSIEMKTIPKPTPEDRVKINLLMMVLIIGLTHEPTPEHDSDKELTDQILDKLWQKEITLKRRKRLNQLRKRKNKMQ